MQVIKHKFKKATSTPKGRIILSTLFLIIIIAVIGGIVYWQTHKKKIIREQLESALEKKSGGLYNIKYETLDLDEVTGFLSVTNLTLTYDSLKYEALGDINMTPPTLLKIHIPQITVQGVKTPRALLENEIIGRTLEIRNPTIEILYTMRGKDSSRHVPTKEIYEQILGGLDEISIDTVTISGAKITTRNMKTKQKGIEVNNAMVQLIAVQVDSAANEDDARLFFAREIMAGCENLEWSSEDRPYKYRARGIKLHSAQNTAHINNFSIDPQLTEQAFVENLPTQDDRFDFSFDNISIKNLDFRELLKERIIADSVLVASASCKIYRDLNMPRDRENRIGDYPHQKLNKLPVPVAIKRLVIGSAFVEYKERSSITKKSGKVQFYNTYASFSNLTNIREVIAKDNTMNVNINTRFLNKAPFNLSWTFYLNNDNGRFDVKGKLGGITSADLNPLTEPMGPARIEDGVVKSVNFELKGNDHSMDGTVLMIYDDLKVALLEKDKGSTEWDKKGLTSLLANIFIKNSNPSDKDDPPKTTTVSNPRDTNRSIFYLCWKTLFKGIKETMGVKDKKK